MSQQTLIIASPCHEGKNYTSFTVSLLRSYLLLDKIKIKTDLILQPTGSCLAFERNNIISRFMETGYSHFLFIDSDMGWEPHAPIKLLEHDQDIVCGVYPSRTLKEEEITYDFRPSDSEKYSISGDLIQVDYAPFGFMMISRKAIKKMQSYYTDLYYHYKNGVDGYGLCTIGVIDGTFMGEDYSFCHRARKAGLNIWCDPTLTFTHLGKRGKLLDHIQKLEGVVK